MLRSEYIPNHPNYVVFEDGDVVNIRTGRPLRTGDNGFGSVHVYLSAGAGKGKTWQVRKLVAQAFLPPKPSKDHVLTHADGDYTNCHAENLIWRTRSNVQFNRILKEAGEHKETSRIRIVETGETFKNIFECAEHINGDAKWIHRTTLNSNWEYKGFHFEYC